MNTKIIKINSPVRTGANHCQKPVIRNIHRLLLLSPYRASSWKKPSRLVGNVKLTSRLIPLKTSGAVTVVSVVTGLSLSSTAGKKPLLRLGSAVFFIVNEPLIVLLYWKNGTESSSILACRAPGVPFTRVNNVPNLIRSRNTRAFFAWGSCYK